MSGTFLNLSLDEIARLGAIKLLIQAFDLDVAEYIEHHIEATEAGKRKVVRNGKARSPR